MLSFRFWITSALFAASAMAACTGERVTPMSKPEIDEAWLEDWWELNIERMTTIVIDMEESKIAGREIHELTEDVMDSLLERRFWLQMRVFGFWSDELSWKFLLAGDCNQARLHLNHILSLPKSADRIREVLVETEPQCHPGTYFNEPSTIDLSKARKPPGEKHNP